MFAWIDGLFAWIDEIDIFAFAGILDIFRFFFLEAPFPFICLLRFRSLLLLRFRFLFLAFP